MRPLLLLCALALAGPLVAAGRAPGLPRPDVYSLHVVTEVHNRYAKTQVTSRVANIANQSQEISFDAVLPETAFVSGFIIEMDGQVYKAYVRGKEQARREYQQAVDRGTGAAHVHLSARDSNVVSVSVNVEAQKKVTFNLTYEELLQRELGAYHLRINLDPRQIVNDLLVEVHVNESSDITLLEVPNLQESNEVSDESENTTNPLAHIERPSPRVATVRWAPTKEEQKTLRSEGVKGQLQVRYDVDHAASPSQILVSDDGYFVHFFSPPHLPSLPKYVVFVLDVSGSMYGRKINQLKQAMLTILGELDPRDTFTIIAFSSDSQVWPDPGPSTEALESHEQRANSDGSAAPATAVNVAQAKEFIEGLQSGGSTALQNALNTALGVSKAGESPPLLMVLTDGQPDTSTSEIVRDFTTKNSDRGIAVFTLAFGEDADFGFLQQLALRNSGFARRIYEAADAPLQLRKFYQLVASPLLSNVNFIYGDGQVDAASLTRTQFPALFRGSELVVAGRLAVHPEKGPLEPIVSSEGSGPDTPSQAVRVSSRERLWAFLTVRQLLSRDSATPNQTLKDAAKDIALKYSFVTPVTSLVVVKPNDTSAVDLERVGGSQDDTEKSNSLSLGGHGSHLFAIPQLQIAEPVEQDVVLEEESLDYEHSATEVAELETTMSTNEIASTTRFFNEHELLNISDVTWLDNLRNGSDILLVVNGTSYSLELASNQSEPRQDACETSSGLTGQCRHLASCVLSTFVSSLDVFLDYFCTIDGRFLGACCPENMISMGSG